MAKDPTAVADLWASHLGSAGPQITAGVNAVTKSPGASAAAAADKWLMNVQAARDKFIRNTNAVTLADWQTAMITKGIPRVATGANAAKPKMVAFMTQWLPEMDRISTAVRNMPNNTLQDAIARMTYQVTEASKFVYTKR